MKDATLRKWIDETPKVVVMVGMRSVDKKRLTRTYVESVWFDEGADGGSWFVVSTTKTMKRVAWQV